MTEKSHRYPRVTTHIKNKEQRVIQKTPGGQWQSTSLAEATWPANAGEAHIASGAWIELFDQPEHHPPEPFIEQIKTRSAIVFLKDLVRDLRTKLGEKEARIAELEAKLNQAAK